jgi:predicted 2-oxoglutarate/Fe(II)-dependent dioxygenase YbiX
MIENRHEMAEGIILDFPGAISEEECHSLISLSESAGFAPAIIKGSLDGPFGFTARAGRNNSRSAIDDARLALALWRRLSRLIPDRVDGLAVLGINERLRFYRYDAGQDFGAHTDGCYAREGGERSLLTLMIYLNSDYAGGETFFFDSQRLILPETGKALIFSHHLWHEGREVREGRKYILRTDVMYEAQEHSAIA